MEVTGLAKREFDASSTFLIMCLNDLECSLSNVCLYIVKKLHKQDRKNILKMNKEVGMLLLQKRANTSGVRKINNYCEDIYIP